MQNIIIDRKHEAYETLKAMQKIADNKRKMDKKGTQKGLHYIHYNGERGRFEASDGRVLLAFYWSPDELDGVHSALYEFKNGVLVDSGESYCFPECSRVIPKIGGAFSCFSERYENFYEIDGLEFLASCAPDYRLCTVLGSHGITINGIYAKVVKELINRFAFIATAVKTDGKIHAENCRPVLLHGGGMEYVIMPMVPSWNNIPPCVDERTEKGIKAFFPEV